MSVKCIIHKECVTENKEPEIIECVEDYQMKTLSKYEEAFYDFDGDGNEDNILLLTSMEKDETGFSGDDRNQWLLMVRTAKGTYPLFDNTTNSLLDMSVYESETDGEVIIRLSLASTSSYEMAEYRYDDGKFNKITVYSTGAINELQVKKY